MRRLILLLALAAIPAGCSKPAEKAADPVAQVRTAPVVRADLDETVTAYGQVEFDPAGLRALTAPFEAQVAQVHVRVGQSVSAGQPIVTLTASPQTRLDLGRLAREAQVAASEAERLGRLRSDGLAGDAEVQTATATAQTARQASANLQSLTRGGQVTLSAPVAGIVDAVPSSPGSLVPAGSVVANLGAAGRLNARIGIEVEDAQRLRSGSVVMLMGLHDQGGTAPSRVASIDRRVDPATRLAALLVPLPAAGVLLPGEAVRADVVVGTRIGVLTVPRAAVLYDGETPYVFVVSAGKAVRRPVQVGLELTDRVELTSGVQANEQVVIEGGPSLSDGMAVREAAAATPAARP
ncbi:MULTISPECIES: efflux RND transporter periplasmic adaptor subunit [unclassified Brevundimonas]|jgi:RND family efflux transporter MFP subunit|uniref:efflux RND transporter periplasmic adaptor subunit n=1 Tax=unclassified Brevundimonas TaxID=2622653 RepID=UPI00128F823F|nr:MULTISPECIES: efflux RND transporter periplasmic adaptor subunit [unclassified Brevundimonas]QFU32387.1 Efflux pump periplasmic linker BepD precursor [Brevundimonas sp. Bb-A]